MNKVNRLKRSFHKKLTGLFLVSALLLSAAGCGSAGAGGDQPGHGKWINSNLPDNASLCAEQRLQDDFAAAVNAEWTMAQNFDPSESYGGIADSERIVNQRIIDVLKDPTDHDPNVEKLRTFYDIYTDWEYRDQLGIEPLRAYLGYIDEDGLVYMLGRDDDVINFGGIKISPEEIEAVVVKHPAIEDCALIPIDDPLTGQAPKLFIQLKTDAEGDSDSEYDAKEFRSWLASNIDANKQPAKIEIIDRIPRTFNGKIKRQNLK